MRQMRQMRHKFIDGLPSGCNSLHCGFTQCDMLFSHPTKILPLPLSSAALVHRRCLLPFATAAPETLPETSTIVLPL
jgi:hypothetical protein